MAEFFLIFFILLIIFFINKFRIQIAKKTNLIDKPNKVRKFHLRETPLLGGLMIYSAFFFTNYFSYFFYNFDMIDIIIFTASSCFFFIGLFDDAKGLQYKYKLFFSFILFYFILFLEPNLQLTKVYFITFDKYFYLGNYSILFTTICLMLLTNAINLIDGIDGLCILVSIIFLTCIISTFQSINFLYMVMIFTLFFVLLLNLKKNIFIGDSGSLFLGSFIGLILIYNYNNQLLVTNYPVENIFIILMVPGIDMLRVFGQRILKKENPFKPDRIHLHYLLLDIPLKLKKVLIIFLFLILIPFSINFFSAINQLNIILFFILFYILLILFINNIKKIK
jgi:UDP-GlcNAc:undecaprenyl-phosphate/decaprenyl-phosphate GlcNAc-1-phosphate transferase